MSTDGTETTSYRTRPRDVEAREVTESNVAEVAEWCGGSPHQYDPSNQSVIVHAAVGRSASARVGDFVTREPDGTHLVWDRSDFLTYFEAGPLAPAPTEG